ncbi:MAG TPA: SGNH/GDSL hydrolase family protein [Caulobacteraceae bacterium]|nr:SGNH/GDSL hydrolase family protein [Caulobacteraceae bacterium]
MRRVKIFAKGDVDVFDSLHSSRSGGELRWNGINEALRSTHPGALVRLLHETGSPSQVLLASNGAVPPGLERVEAMLGPHTLPSQFATRLYDTDADAIVLSILPDVVLSRMRHRDHGFLFHAAESRSWPAAEREWLRREFIDLGVQSPDESIASLEGVVGRIRAHGDRPILIYNVSPAIPGEDVHSFAGLDETFGTRVRRFNLALVELSMRTGVSIIDVDRVVARGGADRLKLDAYHLTAEGYRLVAEETVRVLADLGVLAWESAA